jgi:hypothetical protein
MTEGPLAAYVDRAGNPPDEPVVGALPSSDPATLAAILAALGLNVSRQSAAGASPTDGSANEPVTYEAAAPGVRWTVIARGAMPMSRKETHYLLVDDVAGVFGRAIAAGGTAIDTPGRTSFGLRGSLVDPDGRRFVVIERGTETARGIESVDETAKHVALLDAPTDRDERRSLAIRRFGIGGNFLGLLILVVTAIFVLYLTQDRGWWRSETLRAWIRTIPLLWSAAIVFLAGGRVLLLLDPGRTVGMGPLVWALVLDGIHFGMWLLMVNGSSTRFHELPILALVFYYLAAIAFARHLELAAQDIHSRPAARVAGWASTGQMLGLFLWIAGVVVIEFVLRSHTLSVWIINTDWVVMIAAQLLQMWALWRYADHSARRLFHAPRAPEQTTGNDGESAPGFAEE